MANISIYQWVIIVVSILTLLFGSGLYFRFKSRRKKAKGILREDEGQIQDFRKGESPKKVIGKSIRSIFKISVGDYKDIPWQGTTIRVSVLDIVREDFEMYGAETEKYGVELEVNTGGGLVYAGDYGKSTGVNRYKVPAKKFQDEERCSIYSYHTGIHSFGETFSFVRLYIDHINPNTDEVTLNIFLYSMH